MASLLYQPMTDKVQLALWIAHPVLQSSVVVLMLVRRQVRKFPVFFGYLLSQCAIFAVVFPLYCTGSYRAFFFAYWISALISLALGFAVIHEIFLDIFAPFHTLKDLGTVLFQWAGLVMLLVGIVVAAASPTSSQGPVVQAVLTLQRCVRIAQCGLILFLLVFSRYLGVSWRQKSFGTALGFGTFAATELFVVALNASGYATQREISIVNMCAYNLAIVTWFGYMWSKNAVRENAATLLKSQRWDQSLAEVRHPVAPDSLIPMFEGMVERAFSKAAGDQ